jgi:drug/metabolite transporter (DMT)-like permease
LSGALPAGHRVVGPAPRDLPLLALCAASGMTAYQVFLNAGEVTVPAATASLLVNVAPIFTALLAAALLGERLSALGWCGVALGFAGAGLIAVAAGGGVRLSGGALLVLGAAAAQATFFVSQKALLRRYGSLAVTAWAMGLGAAMALPLAPGLAADVHAAPTSALLAVGFLALGASALGFLAWAYAVARVDVTAAASTLYAVPPVAALVGWAALGEVPSPLTAVGGAVALAGVAITSGTRSRGSRARRAPGRPTSPGARSRAAAACANAAEAAPADARGGRARPTPA